MVLFLGNFRSGAGHYIAESGITRDIERAAGRNIPSAAAVAVSRYSLSITNRILSLWSYVLAGYPV